MVNLFLVRPAIVPVFRIVVVFMLRSPVVRSQMVTRIRWMGLAGKAGVLGGVDTLDPPPFLGRMNLSLPVANPVP